MIGYPPSPAVESTRPLPPPLSPADKIPTNKEQELVAIDVLNKRLKAVLERDKDENEKLEKKRKVVKDSCSKARQELDMGAWSYSQESDDLLGHRQTWAASEADLISNKLSSSDKHKLVEFLEASKSQFTKSLEGMIEKKRKRLLDLENQCNHVIAQKNKQSAAVDEHTEAMRAQCDALKNKMVQYVTLENSLRALRHQFLIEQFHEKRWAEKCEPYEGLDPETYTANKEAHRIRAREAQMEAKFAKIYDDSVDEMMEHSRVNKDTEIKRQRQSESEKQTMESDMKELKKRRVTIANETHSLEKELDKAQKEVSALSDEIFAFEKEAPSLVQAMDEVREKLAVREAEMNTLSGLAIERDKLLTGLKNELKAKQDLSNRAQEEEEPQIAALKATLQSKKLQLEAATIGLLPEISRYRGLVDVVEIKLTPTKTKKQKRTTL